jgi:hypothetical protein
MFRLCAFSLISLKPIPKSEKSPNPGGKIFPVGRPASDGKKFPHERWVKIKTGGGLVLRGRMGDSYNPKQEAPRVVPVIPEKAASCKSI